MRTTVLACAYVCALLFPGVAHANADNPVFFAALQRYAREVSARGIEPSECLLTVQLQVSPYMPSTATSIPPKAVRLANKWLKKTKLGNGARCPEFAPAIVHAVKTMRVMPLSAKR